MMRKKARSQLETISQINVTPLIDLMVVLLIVFMITMPMLECAVDVSPPPMNADQIPDKSKYVSLNNKGQIVFDKLVVSREELIRDLQHLRQIDPKASIMVRADGKRPYSEVIILLKTVKEAGFSNVSLITQAEGNGKS